MHHPALSLGTAALVAGVVLVPAGAAAADTEQTAAMSHTVVSVREDGIHDVPLRWFDDAVVVPGDRAERTIIIRNDRDVAISVDVSIDHVRPADGALLHDLVIDWGSGSATAAELAAAPAAPADGVTLGEGEEIAVRLAYAYPDDATTPPGDRTLTFDVLIRASADDGAGDGNGAGDGDGDGAESDGSLAVTGGVIGPGPAVAALLAAGAGTMLWFFGGRRSRRDDHSSGAGGHTSSI